MADISKFIEIVEIAGDPNVTSTEDLILTIENAKNFKESVELQEESKIIVDLYIKDLEHILHKRILDNLAVDNIHYPRISG